MSWGKAWQKWGSKSIPPQTSGFWTEGVSPDRPKAAGLRSGCQKRHIGTATSGEPYALSEAVSSSIFTLRDGMRRGVFSEMALLKIIV
jgi:hypothetical protein